MSNAHDLSDDAVPAEADDVRPVVVGIGGSAGSVDDLLRLFGSLPVDLGAAFVVVLHLSPDHQSNLDALIQHRTQMPVATVTSTVSLHPNTVSIVPPNADLAFADGAILLTERARAGGARRAIDLLFSTMGSAHGSRSIGVLLSGSGDDGARGVKELKRLGGTVVVLDPAEAQFDGMPQQAIATGQADWILSLDQIIQQLPQLVRTAAQPASDETDSPDLLDVSRLPDLIRLVRRVTGHNLSQYKSQTLIRRIARNVTRLQLPDLSAYVDRLTQRPEEVAELLTDLFINVTDFFRDDAAFETLERDVVPLLFADRDAEDVIRVWSVGCASGEEPYSIAMLLLEYASRVADPPKIQVFATDVDDDALQQARMHRYPAAITSRMSAERLERFFVREGDSYRARRELRSVLLCARHDILNDPPFSRIDLVVCRNLLIYLTRASQERVLKTLHFALRPGGVLFLGSAEAGVAAGMLFSEMGKGNGLFRKRSTTGVVLPDLPSKAAWDIRVPTVAEMPPKARTLPVAELHYRLLEHLAAPSVLVDAERSVRHMSASAGRFLRIHGGEPTADVMRLVHEDLVADLRAALYTAERESVGVRQSVVRLDGARVSVRLRVHEVAPAGDDRYYLVLFEEADELSGPAGDMQAPDRAHDGTSDVNETLEHVVLRLEDDLRRTRDRLQTSSQEHDLSEEELKASNEELQVIIEELRSATEELEVSREELRSVNEELVVVNSELKDSLEGMSRSNADLQNLMSSTDIATLFLDRDLNLKRYTARLRELFNLIPADVGRPVAHITHRLTYPSLVDDASLVLSGKPAPDREIESQDGRAFLVHMAPYTAPDTSRDGVVVNFIDITARRQAERAERWLAAVVVASTDAIVSTSLDLTVLTWNPGAEDIFGRSATEMTGRSLAFLVPEDRQPELHAAINRLREGHAGTRHEWTVTRHDGTAIDITLTLSPILDSLGAIAGISVIAKDISHVREQADVLRASELRLRHATEIETVGIAFAVLEGGSIETNAAFSRQLGGPNGDGAEFWRSLDFERHLSGWSDLLERIGADDHAAPVELRWRRMDGSVWWVLAAGARVSESEGVVFAVDITDRHEAEDTLRESNQQRDEFLAMMAHELRNPLAPISNALELVSMAGVSAETTTRATQIMRRQVSHLVHLVDDLLDISRMSRNRIELRRQSIDLRELVSSGVEAALSTFQQTQIPLDVEVPGEALMMDGDPVRLAQVLWNLLSNARKFSPANARVIVSLARDGDVAVLSVRDHGIGIEPTDVPRIFELFMQADTPKGQVRQGLGIGLTLVQRLVELHGGSVTANSDGPGTGATFVVRLPLLSRGAEGAVAGQERA